MTSSTISVNFNDTEQKTVFTATERCILKLSAEKTGKNLTATLKLNNTKIGNYSASDGFFNDLSRSLANILSPTYTNSNDYYPTALILYLEEGDTIYATRSQYSSAITTTFYSAVFTF